MTRFFLFLALVALSVTAMPAHAQVSGLWLGKDDKDPITDKQNALAMIYDNQIAGTLAARCRDGHPDLFVSTTEPNFKPGEIVKVMLRFDSEAPKEMRAIATEPNLLVIDGPPSEKMLPILKAKQLAVRFPGTFGRSITLTFSPALRANTLSLVGRVLAACDLAPYPQSEIDAEVKSSGEPGRK